MLKTNIPKRIKVLRRIKRAGKKGVTGLDLVAAPLFALDYRKYISDLIHESGYNITSTWEKNHKRYYFITK